MTPNLQKVFGGSANDLLVGNRGSNVLLGNGGDDILAGGLGGRDLLVGGSGLDTLSSNSDLSTIYIGGNLATSDRNNVDSLRAIISEWNSAKTYSQRVTNLQIGVGTNGSVKLNSNTLQRDAVKDTYSPSTGRDFFVIDTFDVFAEGKLPVVGEGVISLAAPGSKA